MEIFGVSLPGLMSQLLLGLVNGSFYAILSLGLAVIFGLLNVINFAHGALFMLGALLTWMGLTYLGLNYWVMLVVAPLVVGLVGVLIERLLLRWIYKLDHLYGLLLTLGLTLLIEGVFRSIWEAIVGASETVLKNQGKNQFATRVELSGNVHRQDISAFQAFLQILRNGFIQAFNARYERDKPDAG